MKSTSFTTIAALLVFGIGGFMAGRISSPDETSDDAAGEPSSARSGRLAGQSGGDAAEGTRRSARAERPERVVRKAGDEAETDRKARLEAIVRGENALDRNRALLAFIDQLGPGDFEEAVAHFRSLGITDGRFSEYAMLLTAWAQADPLAAIDYAKANTRGGYATGTILSAWASTDPEAAIRWAETNHEGDEANPYFAGIIRSLAATDPTRASQLLTSMPRSVERGEALDAFLPQLVAQGGDATKAWIDGLSDDALRSGAMMRVADRLAATDPAGTAAWLMTQQNEATQRRVDDVYNVWAAKDQQAALASMASLPAGENRSNALRGIVNSIASRDPQAAVSMMDRFPNDVTDRVVQHFIWQSFGSDPSVAVNQIARIGDEGDRERMYHRTLESWIERDQTAAMAWIQRNPLPASVQERINRQLNERANE
jgi:hypothetical protein